MPVGRGNRTARLLVGAGFIPRLETLYRYAGRFGSPHHIGCAVAAGERNNKVRLPSQHLLVSDRSCRAPVGFPISMADVPLNLRLGRCPFHCELIGSRRSTLHQFRYGLLLVQPVERTKDLRRASEIPSSANQDLHGYRHANEQIVWMLKGKMEFRLGTEQRVCGPGEDMVNPGGSEEHEAWFHNDTEVIDGAIVKRSYLRFVILLWRLQFLLY